jgi:tetratricopeptide (TPR) repeat protein
MLKGLVVLVCGSITARADAEADCRHADNIDMDRQIRGCTEYIRQNPSNKVAYYNRGVAYQAKGDNDRAIADQSKAIEIDPRYAAAYTNRGIAYRAKGDSESPAVMGGSWVLCDHPSRAIGA